MIDSVHLLIKGDLFHLYNCQTHKESHGSFVLSFVSRIVLIFQSQQLTKKETFMYNQEIKALSFALPLLVTDGKLLL